MIFTRRFRLIASLALIISIASVLTPALALAHHGEGEDEPEVLEPGGAPPAGSGPVDVEGFVRGIDGDTLETWIHGSLVGIGLIGIDAFEANTVCGAQAADFLQGLLFAGFHAEEDSEIVFDDRLRRMYYVYTLEGESIAHAMVQAGMARASGEGHDAAELAALEDEARQAAVGCAWQPDAGNILPKPPAVTTDISPGSRQMLSLPSGFQAQPYVTSLNFPTDFAFLPDGRVLITEKSGLVRIAVDGSLLGTPFIDLRDQVNDYWDRGLLSVAVDPDFDTNGHIYFLFTYEHDESNFSGTKTARLIRVTASGNTASPASEFVVLGSQAGDSCDDFPAGADCIPSDGPGHSGGGMSFADDSTLFATFGEGADFNATTPQALRAQDLDSLGGKLVRITTSGQGLSSNPYWTGDADDVRSKIWASGFRNAYRFSIRPDDGTPYVGDVGWVSWEEVNVAQSGANLGWPCYEGAAQQSAYSSEPVCQQLYAAGTATSPIISWDHSTGGSAVTGGVFYTGESYPSEFQGAYFYGDYVRNFIRYAEIDAGHNVISGPTSFEDAAGGPVAFEIGPDGDLYFLSITTGQVIHIAYSQGTGGSESGFVSDLDWASSSNGWGPVERDQSNGEDAPGDGGALTIGDSTFEKGLGAHAPSEVVVNLDGTCSQFTSTVGVDDEVDSNGSVVFEVYSESDLLASSGILTGADDPETLTADLTGVTQLRLVVTDGGDNINWDHADWADAWIECDLDQTAPEVVSTDPADGATSVPPTAGITATFSEAIDEATLDGNVTLLDDGSPVAATISYSASSAAVEIVPDAPLNLDTTYTTRIVGGTNGVTDQAGNSLASDVVWSFTTATNAGPVPTITSPLATDTFIVGDEISYNGSATDAEGEPLPDSALRWRIIIYHCNHVDCHTHQVIDETGTSGGAFTVPDHGDQYFFEIRLTATDEGISNTETVEIHPETVDVTLESGPAGLEVNLAGEQAAAPLTRPIVIGSVISVSAPSPQGDVVFESWSDDGARVHTVEVGTSDITLTASFSNDDQNGEVYLSDMSPTSMSNHWGPVEFDQSNGEQEAGDGGPLTINGITYPKGLGVHAPSSVVYTIDTCSMLRASIGIDDEVDGNGSVIFEVRGDGDQLYQSDILTGEDPPEEIAVDISGVSELELVVADAGDNPYWDHANWAGARTDCGDDDPPDDTTPPSVTDVSPADDASGVPIDSTITADFSEEIDQASLTGNVELREQGASGATSVTVSYSTDTDRLTITPDSELEPDTRYVVTISSGSGGLTDLAGNPLATDEVWSFTTGAASGGEDEIFISDMTWDSESNGWGPVERDQSNGEQAAGDGGPLTIDGVVFSKGIGVHSPSEVIVTLDGSCATFAAMVGIDDEAGDNGTVVFQVYGDGELLYTSPVLTGADAPHSISVDLDDATELRLVTTDSGDDINWDHADWGIARLICNGGGTGDTTAPTVVDRQPAPDAIDVDPETIVTVAFSEPLDPASVTAVSLDEQGGEEIPASLDYSGATLTITLTPDEPLDEETAYVVTVRGGPDGIRDLAGNSLASDVSWTFTTAGSAEPALFEDPVSVAAGTNAHGVSVADVNEDSNLDLVVATTEDDAVVILLGDGGGGFAAGGSYPTGVHPKFATIGDFNGDGNLDFASANQDDTDGDDVSVYLGDGTGSFTLTDHFEACSNPHEVAAGDLNEDGAPDMVVACWGGSVASYLPGNGDGTFGAATELSVGSAPHSLVVADFNGDGNLDIATADHNSNTVSILPGNGNGTFEPALTSPVGSGPHSMRAGDINRDGHLDLVTANDFADNVTVLYGNGDGTFSRDDFSVGDEPKGVTLGDIDGDGWLDIISANIHGTYPCCSGQTSITVLLNDQSGGFTGRADTEIVSSPFSVATGDFNEDGRLDVVSANWHTNDVAILLGNQ